MAVRTALGSDFYIWHPEAGIQHGETLYIVAHAQRTLIPTRVQVPAGSEMSFPTAAGENFHTRPIQYAFQRGGINSYGMPRVDFVDNYNLFKSPSKRPRPGGSIESYDTISNIPDQHMVNMRSDILTVRKRANSLTFHSGLPFVHRGVSLKGVFEALQSAQIQYSRFFGYLCRGDPFKKSGFRSASYVQ
jgi:hypothetical protein